MQNVVRSLNRAGSLSSVSCLSTFQNTCDKTWTCSFSVAGHVPLPELASLPRKLLQPYQLNVSSNDGFEELVFAALQLLVLNLVQRRRFHSTGSDLVHFGAVYGQRLLPHQIAAGGRGRSGVVPLDAATACRHL